MEPNICFAGHVDVVPTGDVKNWTVDPFGGEIKDGKITLTFENVLPGDYAIMALHDENENMRMDFEDNGMPKESYGISNNVMSFGPPQYDDAKFKVENKNLKLKIRF